MITRASTPLLPAAAPLAHLPPPAAAAQASPQFASYLSECTRCELLTATNPFGMIGCCLFAPCCFLPLCNRVPRDLTLEPDRVVMHFQAACCRFEEDTSMPRTCAFHCSDNARLPTSPD
jgi:hypothetical protein